MAEKKSRKPRGEAIEETDFMKALEEDPAAAMMGLQDEIGADWDENAPKEVKGMLDAETEEQ